MAKKKSTQKATKKAAAPARPATKASAAKRATTKKPAGKKPPAKQAPSPAARSKEAPSVSLGRPTLTAEEKLFMLFHDDYHARQIFEFLRAETVGDLEQFSPQDIIGRLSRPIRETVERIRLKLAERNRCLAGDEQFAADHKPPKA